MAKKEYNKPTMKVLKVECETLLLSDSVTIPPELDGTDDEWMELE